MSPAGTKPKRFQQVHVGDEAHYNDANTFPVSWLNLVNDFVTAAITFPGDMGARDRKANGDDIGEYLRADPGITRRHLHLHGIKTNDRCDGNKAEADRKTGPGYRLFCRHGLTLLNEADAFENFRGADIFSSDQLAEIIAREIEVCPVLFCENLFPGIALDRCIHSFEQGVFLGIIEARRGHNGAPVGEININALFLQGRECRCRAGVPVKKWPSARSSPDLIWPAHSP